MRLRSGRLSCIVFVSATVLSLFSYSALRAQVPGGRCDVSAVVCDFVISPTSICVNGVGSNSIMPAGSGAEFVHIDVDCGWKWKRVAGVWVPAFTTCGDSASADCI